MRLPSNSALLTDAFSSRLLFLINIAAVALIGVIAGDYLFEQTYGWWATTNSVGIGSIQLPVHSSVGMMVMLSIPALVVALAVVDLVVIAVRTKKRNRTTMFLLASPAILVCGLGVILAEPGDLLSSGTVALLGPPKNAEQRLLEAARQGRTRTVSALFNAGIPSPKRISVLSAAAEYDQLDVMRVAIAHGEDVNAVEWYGYTPLAHAISARKLAAVELLIANGAKATIGDDRRIAELRR